jgi:hypothetical protein
MDRAWRHVEKIEGLRSLIYRLHNVQAGTKEKQTLNWLGIYVWRDAFTEFHHMTITSSKELVGNDHIINSPAMFMQ